MIVLNLYETKVIGGIVKNCELSMRGGMDERNGAFAEVKFVFKF